MSNKGKQDSPLVKSVLALDQYLSELERVGQKINSTDMTSDFDVDYIQKLMTRFSESAQGVSREVTNLSTHLNEARTRAEAIARTQEVYARAFNGEDFARLVDTYSDHEEALRGGDFGSWSIHVDLQWGLACSAWCSRVSTCKATLSGSPSQPTSQATCWQR